MLFEINERLKYLSKIVACAVTYIGGKWFMFLNDQRCSREVNVLLVLQESFLGFNGNSSRIGQTMESIRSFGASGIGKVDLV